MIVNSDRSIICRTGWQAGPRKELVLQLESKGYLEWTFLFLGDISLFALKVLN